MRLPSALNWIILCLNSGLLLFLSLSLLFFFGWQNRTPAARELSSGIAACGLDVYYEKGPFVLLTSKDFPHNESFAVARRDLPLSMSILDDYVDKIDGKATKLASIDIDSFSFSCNYSLSDDGVRVHQLMLCRQNKDLPERLTDLNVDGVFDMRSTRDENRHVSRLYVWHKGVWQEVMGGDKDPKQDLFHKQLKEGKRVSFDLQSGQWLSTSEEEKGFSRQQPKN